MRQRFGWIVLCAALVLVILVRFGFAQAQTRPAPPLNAPPTTISGPDLRFVLQGQRDGVATGYFEVHINGNWMPLQTVPAPGTSRVQPITMR